ncbi:hypothetical protein OUHCRE11_11480 [Enterobacter asburiae]|nr:hypothetical protein ENTKAS01_20510 [Enterobacter sp. AS-1]
MRGEVFEKPYRKINEFLRKWDYVGAMTVIHRKITCALNIQACKSASTGWCFC